MKTKSIIKSTICAAGFSALAFVGSAKAQIINIQYGVSGTGLNGTSYSSTVSPLSYTGTVWTTDSTGAALTNLSDSNGGATTVGVTLGALWTHPQAQSYESLSLLKQLDYGGTTTNTITISGLNNADTYDIAVASNSNFTVDTFNIGAASFSTTTATVSSWQSGVNYGEFVGIAPTSGSIVIHVTGGGANPAYDVIDGLQIEAIAPEVPEPSTTSVALIGLGVLAFVINRRRNRHSA